MHKLPIVTAFGTLLLVGCAGSGAGPSAPALANGDVYEADVTVLEAPGKPAMLCWNVATSLPPQCGDIPTADWSWDAVEGEERAAGTTWGRYHVVGRYDGEVFTVLEVGAPQAGGSSPEGDAITSPCAEPSGGWTVTDASRADESHIEAVVQRARAAPDHAGFWLVYLDGARGEGAVAPGRILLNAAFTGDLDRHRAELAEVWGGPLCVVEHERTLAELESIQQDLLVRAKELRMLSSAGDEVRNRIVVDVIFADAKAQAAMDARYGEGAVKLSSALRRVE